MFKYLVQTSCTFHCSRVAQWKRAEPITQRSVDRNHALLCIFVSKYSRDNHRLQGKIKLKLYLKFLSIYFRDNKYLNTSATWFS